MPRATNPLIAPSLLRREINTLEEEPLMAIIPGVALAELWQGVNYAEDALRIITFLVLLVGLLGMLIALSVQGRNEF